MENLKDRVTIYQVAQASGVSLATVSRVINNRGTVTPATRKKVEATIQRLGYKPSGLAQALATNRTTNIGVIIPSANYVYISNFLNGVTETAKEKGLVLTLLTTGHSREEAITMIEKVISLHSDGVIIFDDQLNPDDAKEISSYNVPTIVVDRKVTGEKVGCVRFNYADALSRIIHSYYEKGGDKLMSFLHVHNAGRLLTHCEKTFIETHEKLGKEHRVINTDDSYRRTYSDFIHIFKTESKGVFICYRDSIAAAVMNAALDSGLRVPEDVEIISIVGTKYARIFRPTLSAMYFDMQEVGKRAMYMLTDLLNDSLVDKVSSFDADYIDGGSTLLKL
jgi:LacI family transcriptional regulator